MSVFEKLQGTYTEWEALRLKYDEDTHTFFRNFVVGFQTYLGAPSHYQRFPDRQPTAHLQVVMRKEEGGYGPPPAGQILERGEDGYFNGHILMTLTKAANHPIPFLSLTYHLHFLLTPEECNLEFGPNASKKFRLNRNGNGPNDLAYAYMVELVEGMLRQKPWEIEASKRPIGFTLTRG